MNITDETDIRNYCYNAILLEEGMAEFVVYEPNHLYKDLFAQLEADAIEENIGLWQYEEYVELVNQ